MSDPPTLLTLPGELRNKICQYALTSDGPLYLLPLCGMNREHLLTDVKPKSIFHKHFNKLKFVCKELYAETAGLEIKFNNVTFTTYAIGYGHANTLDAEHWFFDFVAPMTLKKMQWLSTVVIATDEKCLSMQVTQAPVLPHLSALITFAKHHPTIEVRYQFTNFGFDGEARSPFRNFLHAGLGLIVAFQDVAIGEQAAISMFGNHARPPVVCDTAAVWSARWNIKQMLKGVKNFAVWPTDEEKMEKESRSVHHSGMWAQQQATRGSDKDTMAYVWLSYMRFWYKEGISGA
jgi:hypothetical protein